MGITTNSRKNRQNTNKRIAIFIIILEAPAKDQNIEERIIYQATEPQEREILNPITFATPQDCVKLDGNADTKSPLV